LIPLVIIVFLSLFQGCGKDLSDADYVLRAKEYHDKGELQASSIQLKSALQKNPSNSEARWLLGQIYLEMENWAAAEKELVRARELGVAPAAIVAPLGRALLQQGKARQVLDEIKVGDNVSPALRIELLNIRGEANIALGQLEAARAELLAAMDVCGAGKCVDTLLALSGLELRYRDGAGKAKEWLMKAEAQDPNNGKVWRYVGAFEKELNHMEDALAAFGKAIQADSRDFRAVAARSQVNLELGKIDASKADLATLRKIAPKYPFISYIEGRHALIRKEAAPAQEFLDSFLKTSPNDASATYYLAVAHAAQGHLKQAEDLLVKLLSAYPASVQTRRVLASVQVRSGSIDHAIETLTPIAEQTPADIAAVRLLGRLYLRKGDMKTGVDYLQKAAAAEPNSTETRLELGQVLQAQGKSDLALEQFNAALQIQPNLLEAEVLRIMTYVSEQKYDDALHKIDELRGRYPKSPVPDRLAAAVYVGKKVYAKARESYLKALALDAKDLPARTGLAQLALLQGNLAEARQHYEKVLTQDPAHLDALLTLAGLEVRIGKRKEAEVWLEAARKKHPQAVAPAVLLVDAYLHDGDSVKALAMAQEIYKVQPNHPDAIQALGKAQLAAGEISNAMVSFRGLVERLPNLAQAHYLLAVAQIKANDARSAVASLNRALKIAPKFTAASVALSDLELHGNRPQEALRIARSVQQQQPTDPLGYRLEGNAQFRLRDFSRAATAYTAAYQRGDKNSESVVNLARARKLSGDSVGAYEVLTHTVDERPADTVTVVALANLHEADGHVKEALALYKKAMVQQPKSAIVLNSYAWLAFQQGDSSALSYAEKAYTLAKDQAAIVDTLGWILLQQGETKRGLELLRAAVALPGAVPTISYHLAVALSKAGQGGEALRVLDALIAKEKSFSELSQAKLLAEKLRVGN